jgi:hypothetical protein
VALGRGLRRRDEIKWNHIRLSSLPFYQALVVLLQIPLAGIPLSGRASGRRQDRYTRAGMRPVGSILECCSKRKSRAVVRRAHPNITIEGAFERDSKTTPTIQLCDVLLGAVISTWDREPGELRTFVAEHLGSPGLRSDTRLDERKFNVWMFYAAKRGLRQSVTKAVSIRYPLPQRR